MSVFYLFLFLLGIVLPYYADQYDKKQLKAKVKNQNNKNNDFIELKRNKNGVFEC